MMCAGCGTLQERLHQASVEKGEAQADQTLQPLPAECYQDTPHAPLAAGQEVRSVLARERHQLDLANGSKRRCTSDNFRKLTVQ